MSLHDDFGMYYNGTYVGVRQPDGKVFPLNVESVSNDNSIYNRRNYSDRERMRTDHGEEAYNALVFNGNVWNGRRWDAISVAMANGELVLELPDPQYIKLGSQYHWVSYRANRSTKKGICSRKFASDLMLDQNIVMQMYNSPSDENIIGGIFLKQGSDLHYKGVIIGTLNGLNVSLCSEAAHLVRTLQKEWPECQIVVQTAHSA